MIDIKILFGNRLKKIGMWGYTNRTIFLEIRKSNFGFRIEFNIEDPNHPTLTAKSL